MCVYVGKRRTDFCSLLAIISRQYHDRHLLVCKRWNDLCVNGMNEYTKKTKKKYEGTKKHQIIFFHHLSLFYFCFSLRTLALLLALAWWCRVVSCFHKKGKANIIWKNSICVLNKITSRVNKNCVFAWRSCEGRDTKKVLKYQKKILYPHTFASFCRCGVWSKKRVRLCALNEIRVVRKIFCYLVAKIFYEITKSFRRCWVNIKNGCELFFEQISERH
jgi:hypothetical protein